MSSNYSGSEDFENYDEDYDSFEEEEAADEDYDVLPGAAPAKVEQQQQQQQQQYMPAVRAVTTGATGRRTPLAAPKPLAIPTGPQLSDVEMAARRFRLTEATKKMAKVGKRLEVVAMDDLFQMSELSLHDMFSMGRGTYAGLLPAACQTNDDAKEEGIQTEEIPSRTYACQAPEDRSQLVEEGTEANMVATTAASRPASLSASAAAAAAASLSAPNKGSSATSGGNAARSDAAHSFAVKDPFMQKKLTAFIHWAAPLVMAGLGMAPSQKTLTWCPPRRAGGLSGGCITLSWDALLANRPVVAVAFSPLATEATILVAYGPVGSQLGAAADLLKDHSLGSKGCMCLWDLSSPSKPQHVMFSEGAPTCCTFAPAPSTNLVIAGMAEGGMCVWDLEELPVRHPMETVHSPGSKGNQINEGIVARRPSYSTEGSLGGIDGSGGLGTGPIVAVATAVKEGGGRNTPCTVVALTEWGEVQVYTCSLLASTTGSTAADVDLGMRIGSRVRLLRNGGMVKLGTQALKPNSQPQVVPSHSLGVLGGASSAVEAASGPREQAALRSTSCQVLVGGEGGKVLRGGWAGTAPAPKLYLTEDHKSQAAAAEPGSPAAVLAGAVVCLAVSPAQPLAFLCGMSDGSISLHRVDQSSAVAVWPSLGLGGHSMRSLAWLPSRPVCFLALDAACMLHFFDLAKSQSGPVASESFIVQGAGGVSSFPTAMAAAALRPGGHTAPPIPCFACGQDDGGVDVHQLSDALIGQLDDRGDTEGGGGASASVQAGLDTLNDVLGFVRLHKR